MAVMAAAALLDELMGRNRNILPNEKVKELDWEDPEYCKYYMVKFCPHDLFINTKADLGTCAKIHDEEVRKIFSKLKARRKLPYLEDFLRCCLQMVSDVERRIEKGRQRLALNSSKEYISANPALVQRNDEQINLLNERINGLEKEAEEAGNKGNVEEAQGLMKLCDQLKDERDLLKRQNETGYRSTTAELAAAQEKLMEVCEVCGAFLIVGDAQQRIDDHLMGKQHMGYSRLKSSIEEMTLEVQSIRDDQEHKSRSADRSESRRSKSKERERSRHRERSEYREYSRVEKDKWDDKDSKKERRDSTEQYTSRDRLEKEKPRERDRERRHHDFSREHKSHHRHSSSHRRHYTKE